jgi:beta-barrel assembly-enhancing protease
MRWSLFVLVLSALSLNAQQQVGAGPNLYSREKEAELGAELAAQVQRTSTPVNNPAALRYVEQVGARLAAQLPEPRFTYTFTLINPVSGAESSNATQEPLALPGGYIFVPSSVLLAARDEAEFAGVLAHAMAHVADRDGTRQATRGTINQLATIPLVFYGGFTGFGVRQASSAAIPVAFVQFSNMYEQQADALAVKMASGAGYDAAGLLRYLGREQPANPAGQSAHDARIAALRMALQTPPPDSNDEFLQMQNQLRNPPQN